MGVYDCIIFKCPNCSEEIVTQSKSGDCILASYNRMSVPISVAYNANRHAPFEYKCGNSWAFGNIPNFNETKISLSIEKVERKE